jgi:hypothetical protein
MRDCIFLLADKNMQAAFEGFLSREGVHDRLGCGMFDFDSRQDIAVAASDNDPGLYTRGHELLLPFKATHRHAVIVLDTAWDGTPGSDNIVTDLSEKIHKSGWREDAFTVIAIDPELENWIWQRNTHVAKGLGFDGIHELTSDPDMMDAWPDGQDKPTSPKETMEKLLRKNRIPRSSAIYKEITKRVSVKHCRDSAFQRLAETLRVWFPPENG